MTGSGAERREHSNPSFVKDVYEFTRLLHEEPYKSRVILEAFENLNLMISLDPLYKGNRSYLVIALLADVAAETAHRNGYEDDAQLLRHTRNIRLDMYATTTSSRLADQG